MTDIKLLEEKLKYLAIMNSNRDFEIKEFHLELEYSEGNPLLESYEIGITFDYLGTLDSDIYTFAHEIQRVSERMGHILSEYGISKEGKMIKNENGEIVLSEPSVWEINYKAEIGRAHV